MSPPTEKLERKFDINVLGSLLESISKISYLEQSEQDEIVKELIARWLDQ